MEHLLMSAKFLDCNVNVNIFIGLWTQQYLKAISIEMNKYLSSADVSKSSVQMYKDI